MTGNRRTAAIATSVAATVLVGLAVFGALPGLLDAGAYLLPVLVMGVAMAMRRYPGERKLLALIAARSPRPTRRATAHIPHRRRLRALVPRGSALLGCSLAVRPPPPSFLAVA